MKIVFHFYLMSKLTILVLLLQISLITDFVKSDHTKYTTMYDNINYEEIMKSDRLLGFYIKCLLDKGPCTAEGRELKSK